MRRIRARDRDRRGPPDPTVRGETGARRLELGARIPPCMAAHLAGCQARALKSQLGVGAAARCCRCRLLERPGV